MLHFFAFVRYLVAPNSRVKKEENAATVDTNSLRLPSYKNYSIIHKNSLRSILRHCEQLFAK